MLTIAADLRVAIGDAIDQQVTPVLLVPATEMPTLSYW